MKFNILYVDPPWAYKVYSRKGQGRSAENHYHTMNIEDIYDLDIASIAAEDSILFLWVTFPCLEQGFETIRRWGFQYKTLGFCWVKRCKKQTEKWFWGLGFWTRANPELCLIATKGHPKRFSKGVHCVVDTPVEAHSKKPDIVRERIVELAGNLPRVELFARQSYPGWVCVGNEIDGMDIRDSLIQLREREEKGGTMLWMFESKEYAVILAASFLAGLLMDMILKKVTKQGETKYTAFLSVCITAVFLGTYGTNEHALVCTLFGQMLLYASEYDLTTHTVPDYVHVLLLLIGLLEIQFVPALLGLVLVPLPFLAAALFKEGSMGGADIKLMAACGFIMGVQKGYMAMIAGLTLAVMIQKVYVRESEKGFALVPYLSIGCLLAMLL